jgi:signal transduction histidine kinase
VGKWRKWSRAVNLRGLHVQILLWTILPLTVLLIAFSLTGIRTHRQSMRRLVAERDLALAQALADDVSVLLDRYTTALQVLVSAGSLSVRDPATNQAVLDASSPQLSDLQLWVVSGARQVVTGPMASPDWLGHTLEQFPDAPAVADQPILVGDGGDSFLVWLLPLNREPGWLVGGLPLKRLPLEQRLDTDNLGSQGRIYLVGEGDILLVQGPEGDNEPQAAPVLPEAARDAGESGVRFVPDPEGERVVAYAPISGPDWAVLLQEPWEPLAAPLLHLDRLMPFILLTAGAVSLLTLLFGLRYVVRPLQKLETQAERIGQGDFEAAVQPVGGVREIEELRRALDRMAGQVARYQAALQDYLGALTEAQEEERARLARELHDETVQTLIALSQRAQMAQRALQRDPDRIGERLEELRAMIGDAVEEVRRFSRALRPLYLEELGLVPSVEMLAREAGANFCVTGPVQRLDAEQELILYRIAQEALNNALRHSAARRLSVELAFAEKQTATLRVRDDGAGFVVPEHFTELARKGHYGLLGMYERAQRAGGRLTVVSEPGQGTLVEACLPCAGERDVASRSA